MLGVENDTTEILNSRVRFLTGVQQ